jgi:hypothetical protein
MNSKSSRFIVYLMVLFVSSRNSPLGWAFSFDRPPFLHCPRRAIPTPRWISAVANESEENQRNPSEKSLENEGNPPIVLSHLPNRRSFFLSSAVGVLLVTSSTRANAAPSPESPTDDPLFGERLSETARGGKWPQDAAHPLPMNDARDASSASALEEALELSKMKKPINPTTHG